MNPNKQHEEQARAILKRRAEAKNNETGKSTKPVVKKVDTPVVKKVDTPVVEKVAEPANIDPYAGKSLNDLRALCTAEGIKFKNKHKAPALIAKLEA